MAQNRGFRGAWGDPRGWCAITTPLVGRKAHENAFATISQSASHTAASCELDDGVTVDVTPSPQPSPARWAFRGVRTCGSERRPFTPRQLSGEREPHAGRARRT